MWARRAEPLRAHASLAVGGAAVLALVFHAVAPALPTLREPARLVASVPGARVIELSFKPSLFFYADGAADVRVAGVRRHALPFADPAGAERPTLSREDAAAWLREDAPTFVLADHRAAESLARDEPLALVHRTRRYQLLANAAGARALADAAAR
ncbi:MAG: hypothetical protein DCC71_13350 [Proteobacteria bacterium]|nr:MAG: hypothetical protein DCC71_13350 [Pseudomonadota bacterium]